MTATALQHQLDLALRSRRPTAAATDADDLRHNLLARIRSGDVAIAPRPQVTFLRAGLLVAQGILVLLTVTAGAALVGELTSAGTLDFLDLALGFSEFRSTAWHAVLESLPTASLALTALAVAGLAATFLVRRFLVRQHLLA